MIPINRALKIILPIIFAASVFAAAPFASAAVSETVIMCETFDDCSGGAAESRSLNKPLSQYTGANLGDSHGNCLAMKASSASGSSSVSFSFDSAPDSESIYRVSLYTRSETPEASLLLYLTDETGNLYKTFKTGSDILIYTDDQKNYSYTLCSEYMTDSWYKFEIWVDMERDKIRYAVTDKHGKVYTYETDCYTLEGFTGIRLLQYSGSGAVYIDDISVEAADRLNIEKWLSEGVNVPDDIANPFRVSIGTHPYYASKAPEVRERWDENTDRIDFDTYFKEIISEYGLEDRTRWANEVGYYSMSYDDEHAAVYSIRTLLLNEALSAYDVMNFQCLQDMYGDPNSVGDPNGILRSWKGLDTPHSAKPQYIAFSFWNKLMNGAEFAGMEQTDDKYICCFTKDGKRITVLWDVSGSHDTAELPAYGTAIKVYTAEYCSQGAERKRLCFGVYSRYRKALGHGYSAFCG